jgi:NAD(P)-dependent dehydrogenase (short-subunit alcohol dehydrogenase family)
MASSFTATPHLETYPRLSPSLLRGELQGKTVLITGGGQGIGASIARSFAEANVGSIILVGRTESSLKATTTNLAQSFPAVKVSYHILDITSHKSVVSFFEPLTESPDILVNNAGFLSDPESFIEARADEWWKSFQINVLGTASVTQAYLRHRVAKNTELKVPKEPGVVISINTFAAFSARAPNLTAYVASKIAIARVLELVAFETPESVARFISVHPGAVDTEMFHKSKLPVLAPGLPVTNIKLSSEFIVWASSKEAAFLTGRFVWVNWDVDELIAKKKEILEKDLLISNLKEV